MSLEELLVLGLAAQRITGVWLQPQGLARPLRDWLGSWHPWIKHGVTCVLCCLIWFAAVTCLLWWYVPASQPVLLVLAVASAAAIGNGFAKGI